MFSTIKFPFVREMTLIAGLVNRSEADISKHYDSFIKIPMEKPIKVVIL
jgi:hypothetical protein